ncbi:class II aldolase/adducin family protein [Streptomyces chartreusis]|uniref:class II aldolase/adducin family protein n=1 Tax=Streptomyces chartreusis TaxID=1969 RepID=UPI002F919920|nr:class II aldolase/adducin family protein [Streptomyces chartreusis]WTA33531.1 class II aldolase/adducin family protein [Streptomyces chartreusis]
MTRHPIKHEVAQAYQTLASTGQTDMVWGHVSARDPDGRGVWMKAAGWGFDEITPDRVVLVSPDGDVISGTGNRHIEYPIHTEIMATRTDVGAVLHSHAPSAAVFASLDVPLRALSHDAVPFVEPDIPRFLESGDLISDRSMGCRLAETIGDAAGALIPGHGLVVVGPTLAVAVMRAVLLERACRNQLQAIAAGGPARWSGTEELASKRRQVWSMKQYQAGYDYLLRHIAPIAEGGQP